MINFAIIAAGEGSRLKKEGINGPKPLLTLNGVPMIARLIQIFTNQGAQRIHIIINKQAPELKEYLTATDFGVPIVLITQDTPSSLHSFHALIQANPQWENCCLTTTDTIFKEKEFKSYLEQFKGNPQVDAYMGITPFVDDESPLYVSADSSLQITEFTDSKQPKSTYVSGGIYGLRKNALNLVDKSIKEGNSRMRNFQRALLENDLKVKGHVFEKIVDVDHIQDRITAETFLLDNNA